MNTIPGWKLVPCEPDDVMANTLLHYLGLSPKTALREAILAAPVPPEQQAPAPGLVEAVRRFTAAAKAAGDETEEWLKTDPLAPSPSNEKASAMRAAYRVMSAALALHDQQQANDGVQIANLEEELRAVCGNFEAQLEYSKTLKAELSTLKARAAPIPPSPDATALVEAVREYLYAKDYGDFHDMDDALRALRAAYDQQTGDV